MTQAQDIGAALKAALQIVDEASVPDDLRPLAFEKAFDALTGGVPSSSAVPTSGPGGGTDDPSRGPALNRAAVKLGLDPRVVERVLDFDGDEVHITPLRSRFPKQKSVAIQWVATLLVGARQAAGLDEEWTSQALVRQATEELGVDDASNFATHMKRLEGIRARGSGKSGELKMNAVGFEATARLIQQLARDGAS